MINIRTPFDKVYGEITLIQMIININKNSKTKDYSPLYNELEKNNIYVVNKLRKFFNKTAPSTNLDYYQEIWQEHQKQKQIKEKIKKEKEQLKKEEQKAKETILNLIQKTEKNEIVWTEITNRTSAEIIIKEYTTNLNGATLDFVISIKNNSTENKTNILLVKEKHGQILFEYTPSPIDENTQLLYTKIQNSANHLKKEIKIKGEKRSFAHQKREMQIEYNHFIIRTTLFRCCKNHSLEEVIGLLNIITPTGIKIIERIPCAYCKDCNCFYMLDSEYKRISAKGILLCQIITYEQYCTMGVLDISKWSSESILKHNGYNVQATKNLSDEQRQVILQNIIDNKILSAHGIVSYINVFIAQKEGLSNYRTAVMKWKKDKQFILNYDNERKRQIEIDKISKTEVISK